MFDMITHATHLFEDEACLCVAPFQFRLTIQFVTQPIMWIIPNEKRPVTLAAFLVASFLCFIITVVVMNRPSFQVIALVRGEFLIVTCVESAENFARVVLFFYPQGSGLTRGEEALTAPPIFLGCFIGDNDNEIHVGGPRKGTARCTAEENHAHERNHTTGVQLRDCTQVLLNTIRHPPPISSAQSLRLSGLRLLRRVRRFTHSHQ